VACRVRSIIKVVGARRRIGRGAQGGDIVEMGRRKRGTVGVRIIRGGWRGTGIAREIEIGIGIARGKAGR
jgi:hypothetical protein